MMNDRARYSSPYNSALETGLRSVCILSAAYPSKFDLQTLLAFDHLTVHTGDIAGAPTSLHPNVSQRNGELLVRRRLVEEGLLLMESKNLVCRVTSEDGFYYQAADLASVFIDSLTSKYFIELNKRAEWAVNTYEGYGANIFHQVFNSAFDRWTTEFQFAHVSLGNN